MHSVARGKNGDGVGEASENGKRVAGVNVGGVVGEVLPDC